MIRPINMDPRLNPFVPGAGVRPPAFVGREAVIAQASIAYDRIQAGLYANPLLLLGLRGVGKTVLLNRLHEDAKAKGFETLRVEVPDNTGSNLAKILVPGLSNILRRLDIVARTGDQLRTAWGALRNFASVFRVEVEGLSFGVAPPSADAGSGNLESDLPELFCLVSEAAKTSDRAVGVFVDEVQYLTKPELSALIRAMHDVAQSDSRLMFIGAGLPQIAAMSGDAKSYAERMFLFPTVGALEDDAARLAIREPLDRAGVKIDPAALDRIVDETKGYAYFLQTWGKFAWDEALADTIAEENVANAGHAIRAYLDQSFFRVRFDRCNPTEQRYLRAMAELGFGPHQTGDIAKVLEVSSSQVSVVRERLIKSGMIYSQRHGETAFTVPLFDQFMKRAIPILKPHVPKRRTRE
jgi:AAA ATPase domain